MYLHTREPLDEGNIPRRPLLVEKTSTYGNKPLGTEWHIVTARNWVEHSEMLRSMEYEQGTGSAWFSILFSFPAMLFSSNLIRGIRAERLICLFLSYYFSFEKILSQLLGSIMLIYISTNNLNIKTQDV